MTRTPPLAVATLSVAVMLLLAARAQADTWASYGTRVVSSPLGTHYAIVDGTAFDGKHCGSVAGRLHLVRRADGRGPVEESTTRTPDLPPEGAVGLIDDGDRLLVSVDLSELPSSTYVEEDGTVVLVDSYASLGRHSLVKVLDSDGRLRLDLKPAELFEDFQERFSGSVSSTYWRTLSWVDASKNELRIVTTDLSALAVSLGSGEASERDLEATLFTPPLPPTAERRARAWEVALEAELSVVPRALQVAADESQPLPVRVRAAAFLGEADPATARSVLLEGTGSDDARTRQWSWRRLGQTIGTESLSIYRDEIENTHGERGLHLAEGMAALGPAAIDPAIDMLLTPGAGLDDEWWLPPRVMSLLESDFAGTGTKPFRDYRPWGEDISAIQRFRDDGELEALATLLRRKEYGHRTTYHGFLALAALEQVCRRPAPEAAPILKVFAGILMLHSHRIPDWDQRLQDKLSEALSACASG